MPFRMCVRSQYCTFLRSLYQDIANNIYIYTHTDLWWYPVAATACKHIKDAYADKKNCKPWDRQKALAQTSVLTLFQILTFVKFHFAGVTEWVIQMICRQKRPADSKCCCSDARNADEKMLQTEHPPVRAEGGMLAKIIGTLDLQLQPASNRCNS